jgi:Protein of unknown function (DUF3096)
MRSAAPGVQNGSRRSLERFRARYRVCTGLAASGEKERDMHIDINVLTLQPLIALIFGILILIMPRILNYLIAIYLILVGLVGLWPHLFGHLAR